MKSRKEFMILFFHPANGREPKQNFLKLLSPVVVYSMRSDMESLLSFYPGKPQARDNYIGS